MKRLLDNLYACLYCTYGPPGRINNKCTIYWTNDYVYIRIKYKSSEYLMTLRHEAEDEYKIYFTVTSRDYQGVVYISCEFEDVPDAVKKKLEKQLEYYTNSFSK